jgi:hypothetical protein
MDVKEFNIWLEGYMAARTDSRFGLSSAAIERVHEKLDELLRSHRIQEADGPRVHKLPNDPLWQMRAA